jgi:hypothetical protein
MLGLDAPDYTVSHLSQLPFLAIPARSDLLADQFVRLPKGARSFQMGQYEILKLKRRSSENQTLSNLLVLESSWIVCQKPLQPVRVKSCDPRRGFTLQDKQEGM